MSANDLQISAVRTPSNELFNLEIYVKHRRDVFHMSRVYLFIQ